MRPMLVLAAAVLALAAARPAAAAGAEEFQRCAVCHLASGEGVPGAFPPLAGRVARIAATPEGRRYLASVPSFGLAGEVSVGGVAYRGFMPRQDGLSAGQLAEILNYLAGDPPGSRPPAKFRPFTAAEVEQIRKVKPDLTPAEVAKLRAHAVGPAGGK
jgi:mono/diheme cytochrome c family protein